MHWLKQIKKLPFEIAKEDALWKPSISSIVGSLVLNLGLNRLWRDRQYILAFITLCLQFKYLIGLNRVPNFVEYRVFAAVFAEYRYRVIDKV